MQEEKFSNMLHLSMCKLEMASILGKMHVEMSRASICTATSIVVHIANKNNSGLGSCSLSGLLLFNCISTTATLKIPKQKRMHAEHQDLKQI